MNKLMKKNPKNVFSFFILKNEFFLLLSLQIPFCPIHCMRITQILFILVRREKI